MANGGAFGNPLTTGIALTFEVDATPYRQMMQDNLNFAKSQAAERQKKNKEFQDTLKNIAYDDSKIHERMRGDARNAYAETINDMIKLKGAGDYGGMMKRAADLESELNYYRDVTTDFNNYSSQDRGKNYVDQNYINAFNNVDQVSNEDLIKNYQNIVNYDPQRGGIFSSQVRRLDDTKIVNDAINNLPDRFKYDSSGKVVRGQYEPNTGKYFFPMEKVADKEAFKNALSERYLTENPQEGLAHISMMFGLTPEDLEKNNPLTYVRQRIDQLLPDAKLEATERVIGKQTQKAQTKKTLSFDDKFNADYMEEDVEFDQSSGIAAGSKLIGYQLSTKMDPSSSAKGGVKRQLTLSTDGYYSLEGEAFRKIPQSGFTRKVDNAVPAGLYTIPNDPNNYVYTSWTYDTPNKGKIFEVFPIKKADFTNQRVIEFVRGTDMEQDQFIEYYNDLANRAGYGAFKGSASTSGTSSTGGASRFNQP
jgi:hypothetical protein